MSAAIVSSIVSSRRDAIEKAYSLGVITEEEYHSKMQEYGNFSSQNGVSRKRPTPDSSGTRILVCSQWETLQTFESYEVALAYIKSDILGPIKWAKSTGKPGDRRFVCNAHEGCEKPFRICDDKKGSSLVQEYMDIDHSGLPKLKRRKNGIFTYEQEAVAMDMLKEGNACITHVSLCITHVSLCIIQRVVYHESCITSRVSGGMYRTCIAVYHTTSRVS